MIYYSDIGLGQQGALNNSARPGWYHRVRIKLLLLLSDSVLVPFSHLLAMGDTEFEETVGGMADSFRGHSVLFRLQEGCRDIPDYIEGFKMRPNSASLNLNLKERLLDEIGVSPQRATYDGVEQSNLFRRLMFHYVQESPVIEISDADIKRLLTLTQISESKNDFDYKVGLVFRDNPAVRTVMRDASDVMYYIVGAMTNCSSISSNSFFNQRRLDRLGLNDHLPRAGITGDLYDPDAFAAFLIYSRAIRDVREIDLLSQKDIDLLRQEGSYRSFVNLYNEFYREAKQLADLVGRYEWEAAMSRCASYLLFALIFVVARYSIDPESFSRFAELFEGPISDVINGIPTILDLAGNISTAYAFSRLIPREESGAFEGVERVMSVATGCIWPLMSMTGQIRKALKEK